MKKKNVDFSFWGDSATPHSLFVITLFLKVTLFASNQCILKKLWMEWSQRGQLNDFFKITLILAPCNITHTHTFKITLFSFLEAKQSMKMKLKSKLNPFRFTKIPPHQSMVTNVFKGSDLALDKEMCEILQDNWSQKHFTKRILLHLLWSNSHVAKRKMTQP